MKNFRKRLTAGVLALTLATSLATPALSVEEPELPTQTAQEEAMPFSVTVGSYTPKMAGSEKIRQGESYTLIALPMEWAQYEGDGNVATLTPAELLSATGQALFMGSAVASANGEVTFEDVRLRTADAAVYYVTGPGLDTPLYEATSTSTSATGKVYTDDVSDHSATVSLVDAVTGYRYGQPAQANAAGNVSWISLAPGTYNVLISKPGYLPITLTGVKIQDGRSEILNGLNLSSTNQGSANPARYRVGDVDNSGARDMADLAALLMYYGAADAVPQGITADLNGDGAVDQRDVSLLLTAAGMPTPKDITTGAAENVTDARITVTDTGAAAGATLRSLSIGVDTTATVSAAAFSITYRADAVQPLNAKGGLVSPVDGGTLASCLVPASGVTARLVRWSVAGETVTLSFALTADSPKAAGELAKFYYRPVSGTTASFYSDVFTLSHAAAVVGKDTVVTDRTLTYPGSDGVNVADLTIDQQPAAGEDAPALTIPAVGRTAVLPLSATGSSGANSYPDLPGVVWTLSRADGKSLEGVSVERGLLTVTSAAAPGSVQITASRDGVTSEPLTVELKNAPPVATAIQIRKDGQPITRDEVILDAGDESDMRVEYTAVVLDQYGEPLAQQPTLTWGVSSETYGASVTAGQLSLDSMMDPGVWTLHVLAQAGSLQAALEVEVTVESQLRELRISGPSSIVLPAEDDDPLHLKYTVTGWGKLGESMAVSPSLQVEPADQGVSVSREVDGSYTVTVTPEASAENGSYRLIAQDGEVTGSFTLHVTAPEEDAQAVQAAVFYDGEALRSAQFSFPEGEGTHTFALEARLLDREGLPLDDQFGRWTWHCEPSMSGVSVSDTGELVIEDIQGSYDILIRAEDAETGLTATAQLKIKITPVLTALTMTAPESLAIPSGEEVSYILGVEAKDGKGGAMYPARSELTWTVKAKDGTAAPAGVSVAGGVLTVTAAAVPGDITVTVSDRAGKITASKDITLTPAGEETAVFVLYREIYVDGAVEEKSAPVTAAGDTVHVKEGQKAEIRYTAMLVNQTTGEATAVRANQVKWMGSGDTFVVDANAENGVYPSGVTAVYNGQSATAAAEVHVYPNITGLTLAFDDGQSAPPYQFTVPNRSPKTYTATVMAQIKRGGVTQRLPIAELGLGDGYDVYVATALTGLYTALDKASGVMTFTVDPAAVDNPSSAADDRDGICLIQLQLECIPGEIQAYNLDFYLIPDTSKATQAILRRGMGAGTAFSFDTPKEDKLTASAGVFSNCYAMELLDQYKGPVVDETVKWTLTVPDELVVGGAPTVVMVDPGDAVTTAYPNYASIRRLHILSGAPVGGPYDLVLTAEAAGFTCTRHISLTVREREPDEGVFMKMSGVSSVTIPMYYAMYNSDTKNSGKATGTFNAVLLTGSLESNEELDASDFRIQWTVTDPEGNTPVGVAVAADRSNAAIGVLTVDRTASPTGSETKRLLTVTATVVDAADKPLATDSVKVELARAASVPTLMRIRKGGVNVTQDSVSMQESDTKVERDYSFYLVDQYDQEVSSKYLTGVRWSMTSSTAAALTTKNGDNGALSAHVTVTNPGRKVSQTVYLKAFITVDEPKATGGKQEVSLQLPISISIAGPGGNLNGGGGTLGGGDTTETTAGTPTTISISGNTAITTTQGTAASRTYSFSLRDKNGNTCGLSDQNKVTWSATGLSGGLTFNASARTLTVPANALVGTYTVRITAKYSSTVQSSVNVTVTVVAKTEDPVETPPVTSTAATVVPVVTQSGTAGTATLTAEQEAALTGSGGGGGGGGTVTIAPSGGNGLTSLSVNLTAATVSALANQKNQSLKVQTALGTVVLPPAALRGLAGQGGSTVTVKLTSSNGNVQVDFICGSAVGTLPGGVSVSLPTSGNVALKVNADGSESVLKKAVVQNGRMLARVDGSTQLKLETRTPVFSDIQSHWAKEAITFTAARELFQGTSATTFSPNDTMTRSMVVTVLHRLEDTPTATATASFADVAQGTWYTAAVDWANAKGIVQGTANGFKPGDPVTREQLATILYRYAADQGLSTSQRASLSRFSDSSKVSGWASDAMQWAVSIGLITGKSGGVLDPTGNASRAEVSTILQRLIVYMAPTV